MGERSLARDGSLGSFRDGAMLSRFPRSASAIHSPSLLAPTYSLFFSQLGLIVLS